MNVAVVGTGNVGSSLLMELASVEDLAEILVMNLEDDWSRAAIMDVASAHPLAAGRCRVAAYRELDQADLIVLTSGVQMKEHETGEDVRRRNSDIADQILGQTKLRDEAILIALATPVDALTPHIQRGFHRTPHSVMGFGGDLDRNRLRYILRQRGYSDAQAGVVAEHGGHTIPYYPQEQEYEQVTQEVRTFLHDITAQGGRPRNLATGSLLAKLIDDLVHDRRTIHFVCGYHAGYERFLTWPFQIRRTGVGDPERPALGLIASQRLNSYLTKSTSL